MIFKLVYGNHNNGAVQLHDTLLLVKKALESIGHKVDLERNICPGYTNILIEFFTFDFLDFFLQAKESPNTNFIIIATEYIVGGSFNNFLNRPIGGDHVIYSHYDDLRHWHKRYRTFREVAKFSIAVWHLSELQVDVYRKDLDSEKVFYFPHGFLPSLAERYPIRPECKDIDVIFTGTLTKYRKDLIDELEDSGLKVSVLPIVTPDLIRKDMVGRSKLALNLKQDKNWKYPSNSRFYFHLMNRSALISECCEFECDLSKYIDHVERNELIASCHQYISTGLYTSIAEDSFQKFSIEMPMQPMVESLLDMTYRGR